MDNRFANLQNNFTDLQIDTETIHEMIVGQMMAQNLNFWSEKTDSRMERLERAIDKQLYLSDAFKFAFSEEFADVCNDISDEAFEKGLRVGLSLIRCLLTGEPPKIETAPPFKRRELPPSNIAGVIPLSKNDRAYVDMVCKSAMVLTEKQKGLIMGEIQGLMFKNTCEGNDLFRPQSE